MARIRTIKPEFFRSEQVAEVDPMHRLLFIGLWTLADAEGKLEDRPKRIKAELFPYDNIDIEKGLQELTKAGLITRYLIVCDGKTRVIKIDSFLKHQRITGKEALADSEFPEPDTHRLYVAMDAGGNIGETPGKHPDSIREASGEHPDSLERKGKERKGKERVVPVVSPEVPKPEKPKKQIPVPFKESPYFNNLPAIEKALAGTRYEPADLDYYHEAALLWSEAKETNRKIDWLTTLKNWMLRDMQDNKFKTKNQQIKNEKFARAAGSKPVLSAPISAGGFGSL